MLLVTSCPSEIADVLLELLRIGILNIRNRAGDEARCANEANHLHNRPSLLASYRPELLDYYLDVERPSYLSGGGEFRRYEALWTKLLALREASRQLESKTAD